MADGSSAGHDELVYESGGLPKTTNWWGAFVIGLAGTILVTGIAPVMVTELGAASVPVIVLITITGYIVCLLLAELSAMMPDRSGGLPSYAYPAYKDRWPRFAEHVNGFTAWAYWLGWFPVAPLNMILASYYIVDRFKLSTAGFTPIHTPIAWWTLGISIGGLLLLAIPAVRGLRFGTVFATTLALLSMIPLTFLAISWIFNPSAVDFSWLWHFRHTERHRLLHAAVRARVAHLVHRVLVPVDVERDRDGGSRVLHRRDQESRPRREDRDEPRGPLRPLHLHADSGGVHHRARPAGARQRGARRPEDDLRPLRRGRVRNRDRQQHPRVADRDHADPGADPVRAERDHGYRPVAAPDVDRRPVPALLPEGQQARRAEPRRCGSTSRARSPSCSWAARSRSTRSRTSATWPRSSRC